MAASIALISARKCILYSNWHVLILNRLYGTKYYERSETWPGEIGERRKDRYIDVPQAEKPHPESHRLGEYELEPARGHLYDHKPFPMTLKANKKYAWCSCGFSHTQPLCDGTHKAVNYQTQNHPTKAVFSPLKFQVEKDGEYWVCNCKQTNNRPFCDGTHKSEVVQSRKSFVGIQTKT